jgi:hypothetical protein
VTLNELAKAFGCDDEGAPIHSEYNRFERIADPPSPRPDICAFLLLDRLVPGRRDIVSWAGCDGIVLGVDPGRLAEVATAEDVLYLVRCGVWYQRLQEVLRMNV